MAAVIFAALGESLAQDEHCLNRKKGARSKHGSQIIQVAALKREDNCRQRRTCCPLSRSHAISAVKSSRYSRTPRLRADARLAYNGRVDTTMR